MMSPLNILLVIACTAGQASFNAAQAEQPRRMNEFKVSQHGISLPNSFFNCAYKPLLFLL